MNHNVSKVSTTLQKQKSTIKDAKQHHEYHNGPSFIPHRMEKPHAFKLLASKKIEF
ncbi:hypothetical protein [Longirhabdus pacifica]|uniref:hypothetical protein n=1 Tax=Longirhabdus pacifica TaxID=2305227 RepID=UPI0013E8B6DC|nr:hypothetical protein [Longirhabdus pacifica]